ncbi:filamentous haemagglutinin family protein [Herbaspirillum sp. RV1423]|uniref:filamentous haemagglutinin family protein n=1 Tax=Herbaspirillum sp. RV1423 TaxID=1443993 RepID=UPI0004BC4E86|nr:filamentous haemagglutinin family protein [Herbaspirillum sp. RV1423]
MAAGVKLDASGMWSNLQVNPDDISGMPAMNGGTVSIRGTRDVLLGKDSLIDVSSGAAMLASGKSSGGKGGSVRLQNNAVPDAGATMALDGDVRAYGVAGGGALTIDTGSIVVGGAGVPAAGSLQLSADYFNKGFSSYALTGLDGVTVADGAQINVFMPVYRVGANAGDKVSGSSGARVLEVWTPPVYQEDPVKAKLTQRKGASISLQAGTVDSTLAATRLNTSVLRIGRDANITVDPGQAIMLSGIGQITVDRGARLNAWGGNITLAQLALSEVDPTLNTAYLTADKRSIWIGEQAVLDVAARAVTALDTRGRTYGTAGAGGSIIIGGTVDPRKGLVSTQNIHLFVAVRDGAVLDASGSQATFDIDGLGKTVVAGNGGSIALAAGDGLYLDGVMRAAAGGKGAAGGSLSVAQDSPSYLIGVNPAVLTPRQFIIDQQAQPSALAAGLNDRDSTAQMVYGHARLGVDQVQSGGFSQLTLFGRGGIFFNGNVDLSMSQSLQLYSGALSQTDATQSATRVNLAAPYLRLAGTGLQTTPDQMLLPAVSPVVLPATPATLNANAALIDIRDIVTLGFSDNTFNSSGDLRLLASVNAPPNGEQFSTVLSTAGDIVLRATQIYPDTNAMASVQAGLGGGTDPDSGEALFKPNSFIRIERNGTQLPALPYSVFGALQLGAANIEQSGILRAPLGAIELGGATGGFTNRINMLPGSLTSVSAAGLVMPYGGTVDGISYTYGGSDVALVGMGGNRSTNNTRQAQGVSLASTSINVQAGATIDLSGGGELTGAGFISGRGGSTDVRTSPLMQVSASGRFALPGLRDNPVYAIVPGQQAAQAPGVSPGGAVDPLIGQRITIGQGVAGLPAGTYTLMPSTYALLPGAFRVELNGAAGMGAAFATTALRNGSSAVTAQLSIGNTGVADTLFRQAIITPAKTLRTYSQYNEMSYSQFILADAARRGIPRAMAPDDGKSLRLTLRAGTGVGADALQFDGTANFSGVNNGYAGGLVVLARALPFHPQALEIVGPGAGPTAGFDGVTIRSDSLNKLMPGSMTIGSVPVVVYGQGGNVVDFFVGDTPLIYLRSGASLSAPQVMLVTSDDSSRQIVVEQGASINTIGKGKVAFDATDGFVYTARGDVLAVSNGVLNFIPSTATESGTVGISIGGCTLTPCVGVTELYSEGSIAALTNSSFSLDEAVRYGTRNLTLGVSSVNAGTSQALADAAARNALPFGFALNQNVLNRLLAGDMRYGAPALETLILTARDSFNFYGTTSLSTINPASGKSSLKNLVLNTPAIYGYGSAGDVASIQTSNLIWNGGVTPAGSVAAQGAGTGSGTLDIRAERIEFGYASFTQPSSLTVVDRLALGFANVNLTASDRVTANHKGGLSVYQSQGAYDAATGYQYSGGNLNITTPLLTGEAASVNRIAAGGTLTLSAPAGVAPAAAGRNDVALGAELSLTARDVRIDSTIALPSGKLAITAEGDLLLDQHATIDMAGRKIAFFDVNKYSWGGDVALESRSGNLRQTTGSLIDLSAQNNRAGTLKATALADAAGVVNLQGSILGASSGYYDAGGTLVPYLAGSIDIRAQKLGDSGTLDGQFAALNQRLTTGGVFGVRSFQLKQGDLNIGSDIKAGEVNVSVDNGSLTVYGTIDASGERVGSIRLAAGNNLTIASGALLDAHGSTLRVDSYGKIIDSPNRAIVELSSGETGQLTLASGSRIDLRHGTDATIGTQAGQNDGVARGTLTLNAFRTGETSGDIRIDAAGSLNIAGARSIAVNAMWRYIDAPDGVDPLVTRPFQVITQDYLDQKHTQSTAFMTAARANGNLMNTKLAGLRAYNDTFHLRPGLEIASKTADGDLVVQGDLDLSGYRYASVNPHTQLTGVYGSGEAGALTLRAGGNLDVYGSINDGFAPPPPTQDDNGWLLLRGKDFTGGNIIVPRSGVVLADGTVYEAGQTLNYDLPIKARLFEVGRVIPVASTLNAPMELAAGTVFSANVRDANGVLLHAAGSILAVGETLPNGTRFDAGMLLPARATLAPMIWPKNVKLPELSGGGGVFVMNGATTLPLGAFIPAGTDIKLPGGVASIDLRDRSSGSQGKLWGVAAMLPEGSSSWSMRLVAGADTAAADSRITRPHPAAGTLRLADSHYGLYGRLQQSYGWSQFAVNKLTAAGKPVVLGDPVDPSIFGQTDVMIVCKNSPKYCTPLGLPTFLPTPSSTRFSVVRTGAADMDLLTATDFRMDTLYGVYTAGVSSAPTNAGDPYNLPRVRNSNGTVLKDASGAYEKFVNGGPDSLARAWYPTDGGNLTVRAGGNISGNQMAGAGSGYQRPNPEDTGYDTTAVGNWLWRQGSGSTLGDGNDQLTAWWINFGSYVSAGADKMIGFTGLGALGGGNLRVEAGGDAGTLNRTVDLLRTQNINWRSQSLVLAVGSTGRVGADGSQRLTGGGDLDVRIGGALNPVSATNDFDPSGGAIVNLRGSVQVQAAELGRMTMSYSVEASRSIPGETRALNAFVPTRADLGGGLILVPGDATFNLSSRGDQVINSAIDPGRVSQVSATPLTAIVPDPNDPTKSLPTGSGTSWFSLWTKNTALNLFSAGGNLSPIMPVTGSDLSIVYPGSLSAVAASGSLYYGLAGTTSNNNLVLTPLLLAPSANGQLEFLAHNSIYSGGYTVSQSAGASSSMATPFRPAFSGTTADGTAVSNLNSDGSHVNFSRNSYPLFAFGSGTASGNLSGNGQPARFYAVDGDLIGVSSGRAISFTVSDNRSGQLWYEGAQPVWMLAGRDIVGSGSRLGNADLFQGEDKYSAVNNLFVNNSVNDVSIVSAGRDILYSGFAVAGPGMLEITAGRNIQMEDRVGVNSIGPIVAGDKRPGAGIAMQAGGGAAGADYAGMIARYLDPANRMADGASLASQPGKVVKTYEKELAAWLTERYGFAGDTEQARTFFADLPAEQQRVFARQVYFAELTAGGREYNDPNSPRSGSYLRGRDMIASLFPGLKGAGGSQTYAGDITMFGNAGVHTMFGGDIQMLTPGGRQVFGVEGSNPTGSAGVITQGAGNIQLYSLGSILLGQSRIMTTFGGSILGWSATGDINAGRGSKTTVVYTPPKRVYDQWGNVTLSSDVPSTGAGIATLAPIPEVPAGDIDLIAPLGTIDAGEAGIRVSGNVNLAALQVINAANIQVKGESVGIPTIAAVNVGALTNASAAASSAASAAQESVQRARNEARQALPSIFTVRVLGFGSESGAGSDAVSPTSSSGVRPGYDRSSFVQIAGHGNQIRPELMSRLTEEEKRKLRQD